MAEKKLFLKPLFLTNLCLYECRQPSCPFVSATDDNFLNQQAIVKKLHIYGYSTIYPNVCSHCCILNEFWISIQGGIRLQRAFHLQIPAHEQALP